MADTAIMVCWNHATRGREKNAVALFNRVNEYWGGLQSGGKIDSFEHVFLTPTGGKLNGFTLVRGSAEQMDAVRRDDTFIDIIMRAQVILENAAVYDGKVGEGIAEQMAKYIKVISE